ncbi:MAG: HupE/UreJ family protein [Proteobacteria bacterium]|nr:HupE/UreJ family protein [Pseudomonadota bacterium]
MKKALVTTALALTAASAFAHTGHDVTSFTAGLVHPFGADHLLAMLAVGLWSVFALPTHRVWEGPAAFLLALLGGALLAAAGRQPPLLEHAIAASVVLMGVMLVLTAVRRPATGGLALVAAVGALHGLAHGAEAPLSASLAAYAAGFMLTTALMHLGGVGAGLALRRRWQAQAPRVLAALGATLSAAGGWLLLSL